MNTEQRGRVSHRSRLRTAGRDGSVSDGEVVLPTLTAV